MKQHQLKTAILGTDYILDTQKENRIIIKGMFHNPRQATMFPEQGTSNETEK